MTTDLTLEDFPALPEGATFRLVKVETIAQPHPYAESKGAKCDICREEVRRRKRGSILPFNQHENLKALFVGVPQNEDLNAVPGLVEYLNKVKDLGIKVDGFAFPLLKEENAPTN